MTRPRPLIPREDPADSVRVVGEFGVIARVLAHSGAVASGPVPIHPGDRLSVRLPIDQKLLVVLPGS
jgi:thiamine-monophosphate kinase